MIIDFLEIPALKRYHFLTQTIIPRPIAWVLSQNKDQSLNLAPFSFFNAVCSEPPLLMLSIGKKTSGELKDTRLNLLSGRPFVVHIASVVQAEALNNSAAEFGYGDSEVERSGLALTDFPGCDIPRLASCQIAYDCELYDSHELGPNQQAIIYARIKQLFVDDTIVEEANDRYTIDASKLDPLARLGGANYAGLDNFFSLVRPK